MPDLNEKIERVDDRIDHLRIWVLGGAVIGLLSLFGVARSVDEASNALAERLAVLETKLEISQKPQEERPWYKF